MNRPDPVVGVLGLQGDYQKHLEILDAIDIRGIEVRFPEDFERINRLIIPGGESTVMTQLLRRFDLESSFRRFITSRPVWGTCAGMILLSRGVNDESIHPYGVIDIAVDRNGYGRQVFSKVISSRLSLNGHQEELALVFIRAPRVTRVGAGVTTMLSCDGDPVLLAQDRVLVSSFHPELTRSTTLHDFFARRFPVG